MFKYLLNIKREFKELIRQVYWLYALVFYSFSLKLILFLKIIYYA